MSDSTKAGADSVALDTGETFETIDLAPSDPVGQTEALQRQITLRHMIFIALGGSIGAGLFVGSGTALSSGGPLSLVLNFALVGLGVTCTMGSLGEMAATYPVAGSFYDYSRRFISEPWGFSMGWLFIFTWLIIFPFELTCIASQVKYWGDVHPAVIITPILVVLVAAAFLGAKWYGEIEHGFGVIKALSLVVFIIVAFLIIFGGVPSDTRHGTGTMFWQDGQYMKNGFSGFMLVFRVAGMSFGGTELLGMTAAECDNPRRALPLATKITFARIAVFYVMTLLLLGFCVSSNDPRLTSVGGGASVSPFTLAVKNANIKVLPDFFNILIITALTSMANSSLYASSRAVQAICEQGMGPRWLATLKKGVPVNAFALSVIAGLLAYVNIAPNGKSIFDWLLSLVGAANYYTWASICWSHVRFRRGWAAQGHDVSELYWASPFGVWGSYVGIVISFMGLFANVLTAIFPVGEREIINIVRDNVGTLIPWLILAGYLFYSVCRRGTKKMGSLLIKPLDMDLATGLRVRSDCVKDDGAARFDKTTPSA